MDDHEPIHGLYSASGLDRLPIDTATRAKNQAAEGSYNVRAPRHYLRLVDWRDPNDPILAQILPLAEELSWDPR